MKDKNNHDPIDIAYNTQLENLIMPEYGRNVQQLVRYAQTIEKDDYRQAFCEEIVSLIQQLYPQSKNIEDYREKLWKHLFHIAKYNLKANTPSGEVPRPEDARKKPEPIPYPAIDTRYRHYGNNIQILIRKAIDMEPGPIKQGFINTIGSYMKLAYRTWNREHYVSDEIIKTDLAILSNGKLSLEEDSRIDGLSNASRIRSSSSNSRDSRDSRDNRGRSGMNNKKDSRDSRDNRDNRDRGDRDRDNRGGGNNKNKNSNNNNNNNRNKRK